MKIIHRLIFTLAIAALATAAHAGQVAEEIGVKGINWNTEAAYDGAVLNVFGPEGFHVQRRFEAGEALSFDFAELHGDYMPEGLYQYELVLSPAISDAEAIDMRVARELGVQNTTAAGLELPAAVEPVSGTFTVNAGTVLNPRLTEVLPKDQVFNDDVIVTGSLCVGFDCVNGEAFGFDTLRLKENNLRIHFEDTSSGSFPTNDWTLIANSSSNGGLSYFAIEDRDAAREVFKVEAGAPANSTYIDSTGRVGFGTSNPALQLHVADGNTPALRLEQNNSSGFTAQTWDVAGNETNFFVRDATGGSQLPLRIEPGAPTNALYIDSTGMVGLGGNNPEAKLTLVDSGAINMRFHDTAAAVEWEAGLAANDTFKISAVGAAGVQFRFTREGGLILQGKSAAPTAALQDGMLYYDTSGALCARISGAWVVVAGGGTCG